jgi:hypothetical protein
VQGPKFKPQCHQVKKQKKVNLQYKEKNKIEKALVKKIKRSLKFFLGG